MSATITISTETYHQAEQYAQTHNLSVSDVMERALSKLLSRTRKARTSTNPNNPSPSGDTWWDDPANVAIVEAGRAELKAGRGEELTLEQASQLLGL